MLGCAIIIVYSPETSKLSKSAIFVSGRLPNALRFCQHAQRKMRIKKAFLPACPTQKANQEGVFPSLENAESEINGKINDPARLRAFGKRAKTGL